MKTVHKKYDLKFKNNYNIYIFGDQKIEGSQVHCKILALPTRMTCIYIVLKLASLHQDEFSNEAL